MPIISRVPGQSMTDQKGFDSIKWETGTTRHSIFKNHRGKWIYTHGTTVPGLCGLARVEISEEDAKNRIFDAITKTDGSTLKINYIA